MLLLVGRKVDVGLVALDCVMGGREGVVGVLVLVLLLLVVLIIVILLVLLLVLLLIPQTRRILRMGTR